MSEQINKLRNDAIKDLQTSIHTSQVSFDMVMKNLKSMYRVQILLKNYDNATQSDKLRKLDNATTLEKIIKYNENI